MPALTRTIGSADEWSFYSVLYFYFHHGSKTKRERHRTQGTHTIPTLCGSFFFFFDLRVVRKRERDCCAVVYRGLQALNMAQGSLSLSF